MKKLLWLLILAVVTSCDPMNGEINFKNNSDKHIYFQILFVSEIESNNYGGTRSGVRELNPFEYKKFTFFNHWEAEFHAVKDTLIRVIVVESEPILLDSIYKSKDYFYKEYSLKEIKKNNYKFIYPNDGFKKRN